MKSNTHLNFCPSPIISWSLEWMPCMIITWQLSVARQLNGLFELTSAMTSNYTLSKTIFPYWSWLANFVSLLLYNFHSFSLFEEPFLILNPKDMMLTLQSIIMKTMTIIPECSFHPPSICLASEALWLSKT